MVQQVFEEYLKWVQQLKLPYTNDKTKVEVSEEFACS